MKSAAGNSKGKLIGSLKQFVESKKTLKESDEVAAMGVASDSTSIVTSQSADPIFDFGTRLLMFSVLVHIWHLNCRKYGQHLALKDLYEACDDAGDALLEAEIGIKNEALNEFGYDLNGIDLNFTEVSITRIAEYKEEAERLSRQDFGGGISNILDDFAATCNSVIYKLKRLD